MDPMSGPHVIRGSVSLPEAELMWRFSRSSGPGGQHVNTSDSRIEPSWNIPGSPPLPAPHPLVPLTRLEHPPVGGVITVTAAERRSQLQNRQIALAKLSGLLAEALAPEAAA